ncbi:MAG: hypothetical protein WC126_10230 [Proteiniphilum sp.]
MGVTVVARLRGAYSGTGQLLWVIPAFVWTDAIRVTPLDVE